MDFGYSWDLFYGPISSLCIAIITIIFNNAVVGYKLTLFIGLLLSGITMYYFARKITEDKNVALFSSILYITMPYHLTDMYIRNSLGEFLSFVFIPLVFLGLYNLFNDEKNDWILVIGAVRTNFNSQYNNNYCCTNFNCLCIFTITKI